MKSLGTGTGNKMPGIHQDKRETESKLTMNVSLFSYNLN